jgi:hypothetical protein
MFPALAARRHAGGQPDFIACCSAVYTLKDQLEVELQLQLADDDDRRLSVAQPNNIATANFTFDDEFQALKKALYRIV